MRRTIFFQALRDLLSFIHTGAQAAGILAPPAANAKKTTALEEQLWELDEAMPKTG